MEPAYAIAKRIMGKDEMSMSIHTIREVTSGGWSVGYWLLEYSRTTTAGYEPNQKWIEICQFKDINDALHRTNILNGGSGTK